MIAFFIDIKTKLMRSPMQPPSIGAPEPENPLSQRQLQMIWPSEFYLKYFFTIKINIIKLTLRRPLRKKLRMRWFFDVSKVKESSFF